MTSDISKWHENIKVIVSCQFGRSGAGESLSPHPEFHSGIHRLLYING